MEIFLFVATNSVNFVEIIGFIIVGFLSILWYVTCILFHGIVQGIIFGYALVDKYGALEGGIMILGAIVGLIIVLKGLVSGN